MTTATLAHFLDLTRADAQRQWERILARQIRPRQEKFLPVEVLLCYGLFWILNPHRFGGGNIHKAPHIVHVLSATFRRTPGSITSKMLNLDGSRKNGGRLEPALYLQLATHPDQYTFLYHQIVQAARDIGLDESNVPDFMTSFYPPHTPHTLVLLGQEKLGAPELEQIQQENHQYITRQAVSWKFSPQETTRLVIHKARQGQHRFASAVLNNYGHTCAFCGFSPGPDLRKNRLLIASHIKPWKNASNRERLDPYNGIAACPVHDAAFDQGLLTINDDLHIHRADVLKKRIAENERVAQFLGHKGLQPQLLVPAGKNVPHQKYLYYHQQNIFKDTLGTV